MAEGRRLSRAQFVAGTLAVVLAGMILVSALSIVFAREGATAPDLDRQVLAFEGSGSGLEVVSGAIEVADGQARATEADPGAPAVGLMTRAADEGRVLVVATDPAPTWGLVFRWRDAEDHWWVATAEAGGPLALGVVEGGRSRTLATAPTPLEPGAEVDVRFDRNRADLRVDGILVASARGRDGDGRRVGIRAEAPGPAWDDLELGPRPAPVVRPDD